MTERFTPPDDPDQPLTIVMHPALISDFRDWLRTRRLEIIGPVPLSDADTDPFYIISPTQEAWAEMVLRSSTDDS